MRFAEMDRLMRAYEEALDQSIPPRIWIVVRLDGRSFSNFTQRVQLEKPFDLKLRDAMIETTKRLMECGFRSIYGYIESDEISILFDREDDTFKRKTRKWISILAGEASAAFTHTFQHPAIFDARICPLPDLDTCLDYFRWRQTDSSRNSIGAYGYWTLRKQGKSRSQATKVLHGLNLEEKILFLRQNGINHKEIPLWQRFGVGLSWQETEKIGFNPVTQKKTVTQRRQLTPHLDLPVGDSYANFIQKIIAQSSMG